MTIRELAEKIDLDFNWVQGVSVQDVELKLKRAYESGRIKSDPGAVADEIGDLLKLTSYWRAEIYGLIIHSEINS